MDVFKHDYSRLGVHKKREGLKQEIFSAIGVVALRRIVPLDPFVVLGPRQRDQCTRDVVVLLFHESWHDMHHHNTQLRQVAHNLSRIVLAHGSNLFVGHNDRSA